MKIKQTIIKEIEVDISFPAYHKFGKVYVKNISEEQHVSIDLFDFNVGIAVVEGNRLSVINNPDYVEITEQEFNEAYDKALRILFTNRPLKKINLEKSFDDLKEKIAVEYMEKIPTNGRYEPISHV